jgi:predicted regulator of Ras-like GTPase activity (Roadblock/LC7/MglB family)
MFDEAYSMALRNALTEIKNICPDVQASFLFSKEGTVIAGNGESPEVPYDKTVNAMESLLNNAETIGGLDSLVINARKGKVQISCVNNMYLAMVTAKNVDMTYLQAVSRVLIPTVIKLLENIAGAPAPIRLAQSTPTIANVPPKIAQEDEVEEEGDKEKNEETIEEEPEKLEELTASSSGTVSQDSSEPSIQLIVDTLSGLLVRGDTVQIDAEIFEELSHYYNNAKIDQVDIKSFNGNSAVCKVKLVKYGKSESKDRIRIPEKARKDLDVKKGEMVRVTPHREEE